MFDGMFEAMVPSEALTYSTKIPNRQVPVFNPTTEGECSLPYTAQDRYLPDWFTKIRTRQTVLPRFQRHEAWDHKKITNMLNTILNGLPVGAALVLGVGERQPFASRPIATAPDKGDRVNEHLLDGQQRVTGLWRALFANNYADRTYFLERGRVVAGKTQFRVVSIHRYHKRGARYPLWANEPKRQWQRGLIPIDIAAPVEGGREKYREWAKQAIHDRDEIDLVTDQLADVREQFTRFNLPYLHLPIETPPETAVDVFVKMNTSFSKLTVYDVAVALIESHLQSSLHDFVAEVKKANPTISNYQSSARQSFERFVLNACALMQSRVASNATFIRREFGATMFADKERLLHGIERTIELLEEETVFDERRLPTVIVLPALVALWAHAPVGLDREGRARGILRRYLWSAFFTNRYEVSTGSRQLEDVVQLHNYINDERADIPVIFDREEYPLPVPTDLMSASWPTSSQRLARAILALSLRNGGIDLADGRPVTRANLRDREYHHVFPDGHLKNRVGDSEAASFRALNCALITWRTNRRIAAKDPRRYLMERLDGTDLSESQLRERLASHLVPFDSMIDSDYERFLEDRAEIVHSEMSKLCS